jgi:MraZ protein
VQYALLYGEHEVSIDEKNRMLIPIEIRKALGPENEGYSVFVVIGKNSKPWIYEKKYYEHLASLRQQELSPDDDALAFDQYHFARAREIDIDKQGRILLPEKTLRRTGISREITLIGARDHLELWNRADWESRFNELTIWEQRRSTARLGVQNSPQPPS